jgi:hypothetical protein
MDKGRDVTRTRLVAHQPRTEKGRENMMEVLVSIHDSGFGTWVRESVSLFAFTGFIFLHAVGLAFAVGLSAAIDLRVLGFAPRLPLAPMEKLFPIIWIGFWVNVLSGVPLLIANATQDLINPVFYAKLLFVALAVVSVRLVKNQVFGNPASLNTNPAPQRSRILAAASLACWTGAIVAGRLVEYPVLFGLDKWGLR